MSLLASRLLISSVFLLASLRAFADAQVSLLSATTATYAGSATFSVTLATPTAANYQWFKDGAAISNAQAPTLNFPFVDPADAGAYHVVVSNEAGTAISRPAGLSVITQPELVTTLPTDQLAASGSNVVLRAGASGKNLTYEWYFNGTRLRRENGASITLSRVTPAVAGIYMVKITNKSGPIATSVAIVRVEDGTSGL